MWVKICANTCAEDALKAVELGADALGFVFAPSRRRVEAAQVRSITEKLPTGVELVGVFAESSADEIAEAVRMGGLTAVQIHGGVNLTKVRAVRAQLGTALEVIHTVHWTVGEDNASEQDVREQLKQLQPGERVLVDAKVGDASGGLGVTFDWERAARVLEEFHELRIIVAGGLDPENVATAVRALQPYGVDVASGVEASAGRKDFSKLRRFIRNAGQAQDPPNPRPAGPSSI